MAKSRGKMKVNLIKSKFIRKLGNKGSFQSGIVRFMKMKERLEMFVI